MSVHHKIERFWIILFFSLKIFGMDRRFEEVSSLSGPYVSQRFLDYNEHTQNCDGSGCNETDYVRSSGILQMRVYVCLGGMLSTTSPLWMCALHK